MENNDDKIKTEESPRRNIKLSLAAAMALGLGMTHAIERGANGRPKNIRVKTASEIAEHQKKKAKRKAASKARKR